MFAIQVIVSLIQTITAIVSSAMTCRAACSCCRTKKEGGVVYHANTGAGGVTTIPLQQTFSPQLQPRYVTIPTSQTQTGPTGGATALPYENTIIPNSPTADAPIYPPKYQLEDNQKRNGSTYQRV